MTGILIYGIIILVIILIYFILYFLLINLLSAVICIIDKNSAIKHKYRIPEKILFLFCIVGGSPAMYITMIKIRHKTKHLRFMVGIPIIMVLQTILVGYLLTNK